MYNDFKKWIKGKSHIFIKITKQIRELSKLPKYYINKKKLIAKMKSKKVS